MTFYDSNGYNNTQMNPIYMTTSGVQATEIAAGTLGDTVIKPGPGTFFGFIVLASAAGVPHVYDNDSAASGNHVGILPTLSPVGFAPFPAQGVMCSTGITVDGGATHPAVLVLWT